MKQRKIGDWCTVINGDCRVILPNLAFDAIITDPPYGIGFKHGGGSGIKASQNLDAIVGDDVEFDGGDHDLGRPGAAAARA